VTLTTLVDATKVIQIEMLEKQKLGCSRQRWRSI